MRGAFRIFFYGGWQRGLLIVATLLVGTMVESIGVASIWPIVSLATGDAQLPGHALGNVVANAFGIIGIPMTIEYLLCLLLAIALVRFALLVTGMVFVGRSVASLATGLRLQLIDAVVRARWSYFTARPVAQFTAAIGGDGHRAAGAYKAAAMTMANLLRTLFYLGLALWVSWEFFAASLIVVALLWLAVGPFMRMAKHAGRGKTKHTRELIKSVTDALTNIKALKAMNRQNFIGRTFSHNVERLHDAAQAEIYSDTAVRAIQEPLVAILLLGGIYAGKAFLGMAWGDILVAVVVLQRVSSGIGAVRSSIQRVLVDGSSFWSIAALIADARSAQEPMHGGAVPTLVEGAQFSGVAFGYGKKTIMEDVSLDLPAGAITTVIGPSGAGKTTIADLLVGLHEPTAGEVTIDGRRLQEIDTAAWRKMIGYIPQENILFNDSIAENITLGDREISRDRVVAALKSADAWDFVAALPLGIDHVVGVRGSLLSGGQRQRLSIARALANRPRLLILDEATSALDRDTALEISRSVRNLAGELTILAITHQAIWVDAADRVYEMRAGALRPAT